MDKNEYKKSIDSLCDKKLALTADDILAAYAENGKNTKTATISGIPATNRKVTSLRKYVGIAATCAVFVGLVGVVAAGVAGHGPLMSLFADKSVIETEDPKQAHNDAVSAELVGAGFYVEYNETQSVDGFDVTFVGITGDMSDVQMMFTIRVDDPEFAAEHSRLFMTVYRGFDEANYARRMDTAPAFDDEFYDNIADYILFDTAVAYQSADDPQLYTLTYGAYEDYIIPEATIVTEVRSIRETSSSLIEPPDEEIMLHCTYRFTVPAENDALAAVYKATFDYYEAPTFVESNGVEYHVEEITFSAYETELLCDFFYEGTDLKYIDDDFWGNYEDAGNAHQAVSRDLRLVVDGVEYMPTDLGGVYAEPDGLRRGMTTFPEVDYANASSIMITYNGTEIVIK